VLNTPEGSIWWNDTSGYWTGINRSVRPDVSIVAAAGRPNVDGEAHRGSLARYVAGQVELHHSRQVIYCHHDNWMPPMTRESDVGPITAELKER
jgi:hypothetical protein